MNTYEFGRIVKISSSTAAVSAYFYTDGVVYMYHATSLPSAKSHLSQEQRIVNSPINKNRATSYLNLVSGVDITEIIFAPELPKVNLRWKFESVLLSTATFPQQPFSFGPSIHITDDLAFVSSYAEDGSGEVSIFERTVPLNLEGTFKYVGRF